MMEPVGFPSAVRHGARKSWAVYGDESSRQNLISSIVMNQTGMAELNIMLQEKYARAARDLTDWDEIETEDAEFLLIAFGITSRVASTAVSHLRENGLKVGLLRPKTLFPFPSERIAELAGQVNLMAVAELNNGMMAQDVELAVRGGCDVRKYNWYGGMVPSADELASRVREDFNG